MKRKDAINQLKNKSYDQDTITHDIEFVCNKLKSQNWNLMICLRRLKKHIKIIKIL